MAHPVLDRILYLIKEWKIALTELSKYKEDMTHIRDMYRLLKFKGNSPPWTNNKGKKKEADFF